MRSVLGFLGEMIEMVRSDLRAAFDSVSTQGRAGRLITVLWGAVFALYTTLDDVPAAFAYSLASSAWGRGQAFLAVGIVSTSLAFALAVVQRRRKLRRSTRSAPIENDGAWKDLVSTFGIGAPATVLAYPSGSVPTRTRTLVLALFYGFVGQAASYTGLQGLGSLGGVNPNLALAMGITAAIAYRYVLAVREARNAVGTRLLRLQELR